VTSHRNQRPGNGNTAGPQHVFTRVYLHISRFRGGGYLKILLYSQLASRSTAQSNVSNRTRLRVRDRPRIVAPVSLTLYLCADAKHLQLCNRSSTIIPDWARALHQVQSLPPPESVNIHKVSIDPNSTLILVTTPWHPHTGSRPKTGTQQANHFESYINCPMAHSPTCPP
jgi:hypothetical protein